MKYAVNIRSFPFKKIVLPVVIYSSFFSVLKGEIQLPSIFGDHMVLQQGVQIPVWGKGNPGETITVSIAGKNASATADNRGTWRINLEPLAASGSSAEMEINGSSKLVFKDVLIGDVWICSGQSNMVAAGRNQISKEAGEKKQIRFFKTPNVASPDPQENTKGNWVVCTPEEANKLFLSGTGYHFAEALQNVRGVPIGMIQSAWSGTSIEPWIDLTALEKSEKFRNLTNKVKRSRKETPSVGSDQEPAEVEEGKGDPKNGGQFSRTPTAIFNGMIHPHIPYAIKGVIWYQGESNAGDEKEAQEYAELFPLLISSWRELWKQGDFPFLYVQLPAYTTERPWARLRQSQLETLSVPNTGMAVTLDLNPTDNLHPPRKHAVGQRLALLARKLAYGEELVSSGPLYQSMKSEGSKMRISFRESGGGLVLGGPPADYLKKGEDPSVGKDLLGFEVAGRDGNFVSAQAAIEGNEVLAWNDSVPEPVQARYAWASYPKFNLYNKEGLPASPFSPEKGPVEKNK